MTRIAGTAATALLMGVVAGCGAGDGARGGAGGGETATVPAPSSTLPAAEGGPLTDLPPCSAPPGAADGGETAGVVLPDGTVVTGVEDLGELVSVRAYVALTPIQVRQFYADAPEVEVYVIEDEVYEAEILYGAGDNRVFVKAQAQCLQGSVLSLFVGPEDGEGLPPISGGG